MSKHWWGEPDKRLVKNGKIVCPKCEKNEASVSPLYGVLFCDECAKNAYIDTSKNKGYDAEKLREFAATPFWKHAGLPPKPEEIRFEKEMKRRNLTYGKLQMLRNLNAKYSNVDLVRRAGDREWKQSGVKYSKREV